jgi:DNA-binding response OmpR family regulator
MGGDQLFYELKKISQTARVILASGYFDPQAKSEILKAGVRDFVQKPYVPDDILKRIRAVFDSKEER